MLFKIYCFFVKMFRIKILSSDEKILDKEIVERLLKSLSTSLDSAKIEIDLLLARDENSLRLETICSIQLDNVFSQIHRLREYIKIK